MNNEAYQWNRSKPVYSGIPSFKFERFKEEYHKQMDLAKEDELIKLKGFLNNETKYMLDVETLKIKPFNNIIDKNNTQILYGLKKGKFKDYTKNSSLVEFPIKDLNMEKYIARPKQTKPAAPKAMEHSS